MARLVKIVAYSGSFATDLQRDKWDEIGMLSSIWTKEHYVKNKRVYVPSASASNL